MRRRAKWVLLPLAVALAASLTSTLFWHHQTTKETTFPEPAPAARYAEGDEGKMAVLAIEKMDKDKGRELSTWVKDENQDRFVALLKNAQAGLGWYVHEHGPWNESAKETGRPVHIVLPWKDVGKMEQIAGDPDLWAENHRPSMEQAPAGVREHDPHHPQGQKQRLGLGGAVPRKPAGAGLNRHRNSGGTHDEER